MLLAGGRMVCAHFNNLPLLLLQRGAILPPCPEGVAACPPALSLPPASLPPRPLPHGPSPGGERLRGPLLGHAEDDLEHAVPARDRPERLEDVRPEGVQLRGGVEVGDRRLAVKHALALAHSDVERRIQAVT